jgi:sjoegren syndrome nuclear autoantigen 1
LQNYNNELVKMLESLKERREDIHSEIVKQEEEKFKIEKEMSILGERLERVNGKFNFDKKSLMIIRFNG